MINLSAKYPSDKAKEQVLKKFPKAICSKEEDLPIFYVELGDRHFAGFSEAAAWNYAAIDIDKPGLQILICANCGHLLQVHLGTDKRSCDACDCESFE